MKQEKKCSRCKELLPASEFHKNRSVSDGLHAYCRPCRNTYKKAQYLKKNPIADITYGANLQGLTKKSLEKVRRNAMISIMASALGQDVCQHCGEDGSNKLLEWDHIDPRTKVDCVSQLKSKASKAHIWAEIKKCQRLCRPCHIKKSIANGELGPDNRKKSTI